MNIFEPTLDFIRQLYDQLEGFIPLHAPIFRGNEKKYVEECIDSTFVSSVGKFVDQFEIEMAKYTGTTKAVACVNGTNALHLALLLAGVKPEDEVITQSLTFIATCNAIHYCGAKPVFLDVDRDTMGLSPNALRTWLVDNTFQQFNKSTNQPETINKKTGKCISACVPMHTFGHPCRIDEIVEICHEYTIPVVEDAAESLGSLYKGKHTGTFGKIGVLSFNGNKIITTGGGGMLLFQEEELGILAKHLTTQAKVPHAWEFVHDHIGYNYRMPNINAALGCAQMEQLEQILQNKREIAHAYRDFFNDSTLKQINDSTNQRLNKSTIQQINDSTITYFDEPENCRSNYWLNCILLKDKKQRDEFLRISNEAGVMTRPAWQLMNELDMFKECEADKLKNAKYLSERLINIPSSVFIK